MSKQTSKWRKYLLGTWSWKRPIYSLLSIYLIFFIIVLFFADALIFQPPAGTYSDTQQNLVLLVNDKQQEVASVYLEAEPNRPTILWSHGNAETIGTAFPLLQYLNRNEGIGFIAYDYPGYGLSEGKPNEQGCYANIEATWKFLTEDKKIAPENIIILGQSVGSGPSTYLAEKVINAGTPPSALILISPFTSINRVPFGVNVFPNDRFSNISRIKNITCPLLIIHGDKDKVISQSHGKELFEKSPLDATKKQFLDLKDTGHNDLLGKELFLESLLDFIRKTEQR